MGYTTEEGPGPDKHPAWPQFQRWLDADHDHSPNWAAFLAGWDAKGTTEISGATGYARPPIFNWHSAAAAAPQAEVGVPKPDPNAKARSMLLDGDGPYKADPGPMYGLEGQEVQFARPYPDIEGLDRRVLELVERVAEQQRDVGSLAQEVATLAKNLRNLSARTEERFDIEAQESGQLAAALDTQLTDLGQRVQAFGDSVIGRLQNLERQTQSIDARVGLFPGSAAALGKLRAALDAERWNSGMRVDYRHGVQFAIDRLDEMVRSDG